MLGLHFSIGALILSFCLIQSASAQIHISGPLSGTLRTDTYIVEDHISVSVDDSLVIEPGVICLFDGPFDFNIYGYLYAVGTETDSLIFKPNDGVPAFGSIVFENGSSHGSELSYTYITGSSTSAINAYYVNITISHCTIAENNANWGGGIYFSHVDGIISDCVVTDNTAIHNGGGIYCTGASPTIENCQVLRNYSNFTGGDGSGRGGGGICVNHGSSPTITDCVIDDNITEANGGAVAVNDNSHATILNCTMNNNTADSSGGGLFVSLNCTPIIDNCQINNNSTQMDGGGVSLETSISASIDSCTILSNTADMSGGGIFCSESSPELNRCTISGNSAFIGGAIYAVSDTSLIINNCTISGNQVLLANGAGIYLAVTEAQITNTIVEGHNDVGVFFLGSETTLVKYSDFIENIMGSFMGSVPAGLGTISTVNANGDSCDVFYNIFLDPMFVDPINNDFHLLEDSPCIDAGDPTSPLDPDGSIADIGVHYYEHTGMKNKDEPGLPATFTVSNFPNPFNPTTTISFDLPVASQVQLDVFDINSRNVGATRASPFTPGHHQITFDGSGLASGIYIYRLAAGDFTASGKMVLMK